MQQAKRNQGDIRLKTYSIRVSQQTHTQFFIEKQRIMERERRKTVNADYVLTQLINACRAYNYQSRKLTRATQHEIDKSTAGWFQLEEKL